MNYNGKPLSDTERLRVLRMDEVEGERSPAAEELMEEVEKLTAQDLIFKMRRVQQLAPRWSEHSRAQYAKQFEALSLQFCAAAAYLKRHRVDEEVPAWLREG